MTHANTTVFPLPIEPMPLQQATQRVWEIRRLFRERALDASAGRLAVAPFVMHPSDRVARLAIATLADLDDTVRA